MSNESNQNYFNLTCFQFQTFPGALLRAATAVPSTRQPSSLQCRAAPAVSVDTSSRRQWPAHSLSRPVSATISQPHHSKHRTRHTQAANQRRARSTPTAMRRQVHLLELSRATNIRATTSSSPTKATNQHLAFTVTETATNRRRRTSRRMHRPTRMHRISRRRVARFRVRRAIPTVSRSLIRVRSVRATLTNWQKT